MSVAGKRQSGFTLLETLVVVAITAMIAAIIAPEMMRALDILTLHQSARLLQADLRVARATAIRTGQKVDLEASNHGHEYDWIGGSRFLPPTITLSMSGPYVVYPDGSIQPATITLTSQKRNVTLTVDAVTGAIAAANAQ